MADKLDGSAIVANTIPSNRIQSSSITQTQLQPALYTTITQATHPKIRSLTYPGNDTAANTGGGDTIVVNGTGFGNTGNVQIYINGNAVSSITVTNSNSVSFTAPALSAATYPLYLINTSDGSTAILIPGIQYSGVPTWTTTTPLSNQDAGSAWSIQLVATSDSAISYSLQAGSSLPAGITLAANGLISGTMTSPPTDETTYNFTVVANDLEQQDASRAFNVTVTVAVLDPYFTYTTLLLHGDGTNNANNHAFVDSSNNAFAITRNGNASQGTFSPFGDNWSVYFDGNGDYLTVPDSDALEGFSDFTIEFWLFIVSKSNGALITKGANLQTTYSPYVIYFNGSGDLRFLASTTGSSWLVDMPISLSANLPMNQWMHVAVTRSGSTFYTFVNGVLINSNAAGATALMTNSEVLSIGSSVPTGQIFYFGACYVSNLRILKGTALYTANFTPPTQPYTSIANTSLLTCQSNAFIDKGPNRFAITRAGDTRVSKFDPFKPYKAVPASYGVYFDGTGDYLTVPDDANWNLTSSTGSYELFVYPVAAPSNTPGLIGQCPTTANWGTYLYSDGRIGVGIQGTSELAAAAGSLTVGAWNHIVFTRDNSDSRTRIFVNGVLKATGTGTYFNDSSAALHIGHFNNYSFNGHISNVRVCKGSIPSSYITSNTTVGTTIFTTPTSALTAVANTVLLACQSTTIIDNSTNAYTITRNGDALPTDLNPFTTTFVSEKYNTANGGGAVYFDGSGDYLTGPNNSAVSTSGGNYLTCEAWIYPTSHGSERTVFFRLQLSGSYPGYILRLDNGFPLIGSSSNDLTSSVAAQLNAWNHVAFVFDSSGNQSIYLNGVRTATRSNGPTTMDYSANLIIGGDGTGTRNFFGYIASARIIKQSTPYYSGTTINVLPSAPFTAIANTSFLCNFTNAGILDSVGKNVLETVGDARVNTSVKKYGTGSMYFDGSGDYLRSPYNPDLQMKTADFTIECWVYLAAAPVDYGLIFNTRNSTAQYSPLQVYVRSTRVVEVYMSTNGSTNSSISTTLKIPLTTWSHLAVVRINGVVRVFIDGLLDGASMTVSSALYEDTTWGNNIGGESGGNPLIGNIDDLRITKGVARYRYNFTPPTKAFNDGDGNLANNTTDVLVGDQVNTPVFPYTTLLLHGDGTNNANNHAFLDSSNNAFAITRNGNATQGTFSPFSPTGWSNFFDGNGDYLSFTGSSALTASADFTFECWIFVRSIVLTGSSNPRLIEMPNGLTLVLVTSTNNLRVDNESNGTSPISTGSGSIQLNQWMHVAVVRGGSTLTAYLNGVNAGSATHSTTFTGTGTVTIGYSAKYGSVAYFDGYISNLRYIVGNALYTANFTPATSALTAVANTQLLTCQNNRFIDNSNNAFALTRGGDASIQAFSPYAPSVEYTANTHGGSAYFDGSGDYLETTSSQIIPSGNFTIEAWAYITSSSATQTIVAQGTGVGDGARTWMGIENSSGAKWAVQVGGTQAISSVTPVLNTWHYLAMVYNGSTIKMFLNGTEIASAASTTNASNTTMRIGTNWGSYITTGYISNIRISNTNRTINTAPSSLLSADGNTVFLANFTNAGILDSTGKNVLETVGDAKVNTATKKYGTGSMYFDGTGDYLVTPSTAVNTLAGDFTVEMWVYRSAGNNFFFTLGDSVGSTGFDLYIGNTGANLRLYSGNSVVIDNALSSVNFPTSTWTHLAIVRSSGSVRVYVAGMQAGSAWSSTAVFSGKIYVGAEFYNGSITGTCNGYMDDVRVTNGIARYVQNFTPPTAAFLNK